MPMGRQSQILKMQCHCLNVDKCKIFILKIANIYLLQFYFRLVLFHTCMGNLNGDINIVIFWHFLWNLKLLQIKPELRFCSENSRYLNLVEFFEYSPICIKAKFLKWYMVYYCKMKKSKIQCVQSNMKMHESLAQTKCIVPECT